MRKTLLAALGVAALVMSQDAQAQVRDCVIVGNILPIGQNSVGAIELSSGETCNMFLTATGTVLSSGISERPKHGTLTLEGAGSMSTSLGRATRAPMSLRLRLLDMARPKRPT